MGGPGTFIFAALVAGAAAAWLLHPAGVAYQGKADDEYDLFLRTLDSPAPRQLTHAPGEAVPLGWLPDSSHMLYSQHTSRQAPNEVLSVATVGR